MDIKRKLFGKVMDALREYERHSGFSARCDIIVGGMVYRWGNPEDENDGTTNHKTLFELGESHD